MGLPAGEITESGPALHEATVIWYNQVQGFGFLAVKGYPHDLFVHNREVRQAQIPAPKLVKGFKVRCAIGSDKKNRPVATSLEEDRG